MSLCGLAEEVEVLGHERGEFIGIVPQVVQNALDGRTKRRKGRVEAVPRHMFAKELPEALDQVQIRGGGGQKHQGDREFLGQFLHPMRTLGAGSVQHHKDRYGAVGMSRPEFLE